VTDARWIAVHAPDLEWAKDADAALAKLDAAHPLTSDEWMTRGHALADAGRANDAILAFNAAGVAPGKAIPPLERLHAKGDALFRARSPRWIEAHTALASAANQGGPHAAEDAFLAARALSRADHDDEAIAEYAAVERGYPKTTWADESAFYAARLHLLRGRWRDAANALDEYARRYPQGTERREASRDRALSHLLAGDYKTAQKLFEQLADDEPDALGSARALTMAALAAFRDGDRTHAVARWSEVAKNRPLSWPALVSRARLAEVGATLPPLIEPGDSGAALPPLSIKLPPPVDVLHRVGLDADAEDALRERESVLTASAPGRGVEALCAAYASLGRARRQYQIAQQIPAQLLAASPTLRTRWAWECAYPRPYESTVLARQASESLPDDLIYAVMRQESGFDPDAISPARAVGLLQLLPETAKTVAAGASLSTDDARLTSPPHNIALGSLYLRELIDKFHGAVPLALGAYNGGPEAIARWIGRSQGTEIDVFVEKIPFVETRGYVARVMGNLARYGYLRRGEAGVPKIRLALE
jgi:soluble lytic murein transglycosylase